MLDLVLKNGRVIDGTGNPWFFGDVGVKNGVIAGIGRLTQKSEQTVNVQCCVISPGFIDGHCHSDLMVLNNPRSEIKLRQGVTTEVLGNCGIAVAPSTNENLDLLPKATNTAKHPKSVMPHKGGRRRRAGGELTARLPRLSWNVIRPSRSSAGRRRRLRTVLQPE